MGRNGTSPTKLEQVQTRQNQLQRNGEKQSVLLCGKPITLTGINSLNREYAVNF